jgi:hypothetical protein
MKNVSAKLVCVADLDFTNSRYWSNETFLVLQEILLRAQEGFIFHRNHFIFHLTDNIVGELLPSGILQHSKEYHWFFTDLKDSYEERGPKVLRITDLSFGFVLWLAACCVSSIAFVTECVIPKIKHLFNSMFGLVLFLMVLRWKLSRIS